MTLPLKIAFFAPIKPPDHPIPSGDRLIAQNLMRVFEQAGHKVELASHYICYSKRSNLEILEERKSGALEEANRLLAEFSGRNEADRPDIWITYHPYCKAPDWIGPIISASLGIPYVTIEAAKTGQGGTQDEWAPWRTEAQAGIKQADMHLVFKPTDRAYLAELLGETSKLRDFPTFMDIEVGEISAHELPDQWDPKTPVLVTTGMMRKGKKDKNFYMLAEILSGIIDREWNLIVVGGGPEEENIRSAFSEIPNDRMHWTGQIKHKDVLRWMKACDVFIWPGWKEPIGMVYLEAELQGLPVVAYESMGVPLVVSHNKTGLLAPEGDVSTIRDNVMAFLENKELRNLMGVEAKAKVLNEHSIETAAYRFNEILRELKKIPSPG